MRIKSIRSNFTRAVFSAACGVFLLSSASVAAPVSSGMTTVSVNPSTLSTLTGAGFTLAPIAPATVMSTSPLAVSFPITGGNTTSMIDHSGGLSLTNNGTTVMLENFIIDVPGNVLTGAVTANNATTNGVTLFNLGSNASLNISSMLASDLSTIYGLPDLTGANFGSATISPGAAGAVPEPASLALMAVGLLGAWGWARAKRS